MAHRPLTTFRRCVARYDGEHEIERFACLQQLLVMAFAQPTFARACATSRARLAHLRRARAAADCDRPFLPGVYTLRFGPQRCMIVLVPTMKSLATRSERPSLPINYSILDGCKLLKAGSFGWARADFTGRYAVEYSCLESIDDDRHGTTPSDRCAARRPRRRVFAPGARRRAWAGEEHGAARSCGRTARITVAVSRGSHFRRFNDPRRSRIEPSFRFAVHRPEADR